ncbi:MAG: tetraacyldisaccharide 4'-kinase [Gammaproteobacteria bacterium]
MKLHEFLNCHWYASKRTWFAILMMPFAWLFSLVAIVRRWCYQNKILPSHRFDVPVIVVGNITVGGTGKTPLVIALFHYLKNAGYKPGIVSRGYKGQIKKPYWVTMDSDPRIVGDEALLLARRTDAPVVVFRDRVVAIESLLQDTDCDLIISDDGLQHYRMQRDVEIVVIDGQRGLGNVCLLPAGPLREPKKRLDSVDVIVAREKDFSKADFIMKIKNKALINVADRSKSVSLDLFKDQTVHAVAGIGYPKRFFDMLSSKGLHVIPHAFADHHAFVESDLNFDDSYPIIMTEKDAVKCEGFAKANQWYLPIEAEIDDKFFNLVLKKTKF